MRHHPPAQLLRERSLWAAQPEDRPAGAAPAARPSPPPWPRPGRPFKAAAQRPHVPAPRHFRRAPRHQPMGARVRPLSPPPGVRGDVTRSRNYKSRRAPRGYGGLRRPEVSSASDGTEYNRDGDKRNCHISPHYVYLFTL